MEVSMEVSTEVLMTDGEYGYLSFREGGGTLGYVVVTTPYDPSANNIQHTYKITKMEWKKLLKAFSLFFMEEE